jgi:hypothetical protein
VGCKITVRNKGEEENPPRGVPLTIIIDSDTAQGG